MENTALENAKIKALSALTDTAVQLSTALSKISAYVPTKWVDNSEPYINANNLLHIENGIKAATDALNLAVDAINKNSNAISALNTETIKSIIITQFSSDQATYAPEELISVDIPFTIPSDYALAGIVRAWISAPWVATYNGYLPSEGVARISGKNISSEYETTGSAYVSLLFVKK